MQRAQQKDKLVSNTWIEQCHFEILLGIICVLNRIETPIRRLGLDDNQVEISRVSMMRTYDIFCSDKDEGPL
jgi:hypothetical protein